MVRELNVFETLEILMIQPLECRICTHRWCEVIAPYRDVSRIRCPNCGQLASERREAEL